MEGAADALAAMDDAVAASLVDGAGALATLVSRLCDAAATTVVAAGVAARTSVPLVFDEVAIGSRFPLRIAISAAAPIANATPTLARAITTGLRRDGSPRPVTGEAIAAEPSVAFDTSSAPGGALMSRPC